MGVICVCMKQRLFITCYCVFLSFQWGVLGSVRATRGLHNREDNCSHFQCSPLLLFVGTHFLCGKGKNEATFPNREDFNFQREAYECRIPFPVETEIHTTWNALVAQTSPTVSSCNAIIPRCRGKGSPIFCVADFYCLVQHLSTWERQIFLIDFQ